MSVSISFNMDSKVWTCPCRYHCRRRWEHSTWMLHSTASCEVFGKRQKYSYTWTRADSGMLQAQEQTFAFRIDLILFLASPCWAKIDHSSDFKVDIARIDCKVETDRATCPMPVFTSPSELSDSSLLCEVLDESASLPYDDPDLKYSFEKY